MSHQAIVPRSSYRIFGPGQVCLDAKPGSLYLSRGSGFLDAGIRFFEHLRVPSPYCWTNHAATTITGGPNAVVAQAKAQGIILTPLAELEGDTYAIVDITCTPEQRACAVLFARWAVDLGYGYLQIVADAFNGATGIELSAGLGQRMVCSTAATRALERQGLIPGRTPAATTPAHLAMWFDVRLPIEGPVKVSVDRRSTPPAVPIPGSRAEPSPAG